MSDTATVTEAPAQLQVAELAMFRAELTPPGRRAPVVYIAGPYRYHPEVGRTELENIRLAETAAIACARAGVYFFCPHLNSAHQTGIAPPAFYLGLDLQVLRRCCDALLLLPGWQYSSGTLGEIELARELNRPVFQLSGPPFTELKGGVV